MLLPQLPCVHRCVSEMRVCVYVCACVCVSMGYEGPTLCSHEDKENGGGVCVCVCVRACVCICAQKLLLNIRTLQLQC